jgi:hypothetical protein
MAKNYYKFKLPEKYKKFFLEFYDMKEISQSMIAKIIDGLEKEEAIVASMKLNSSYNNYPLSQLATATRVLKLIFSYHHNRIKLLCKQSKYEIIKLAITNIREINEKRTTKTTRTKKYKIANDNYEQIKFEFIYNPNFPKIV